MPGELKRCYYCGLEKPRVTFVNRRRCYDCASTKQCKVCKLILPISSFSQFYGKVCRSCRKDYNATRYLENKSDILAKNKKWKIENAPRFHSQQKDYRTRKRAEMKAEVLAHYDGRCDCCGETEILFLTIDHINGNGWEHRRMIGKTDMWKWLYHNDYPDGFRILCYNCNAGRYHNGGVCPHQLAATPGIT
jgi:hypothetical protein